MHNLAVLDADGGGKDGTTKGASQWFRKAADRGIAEQPDSISASFMRAASASDGERRICRNR